MRAGVSFGGLLAVVLVIAAVAGSFAYLDMPLGALFAGAAAGEIVDFVGRFFPPELGPAFLAKVGWAALETLAISLVSTVLAAVAGAVLALPAAGRHGVAGQVAARFVLNLLRSVPELVWATLMVLAAGLGPFAGTLALALHTTGVLGRLFAEALENTPPAPAEALAGSGAPSLAAFLYGTFPLVAAQWLAYALYRWEMNIRMAAILGFVGAGGLGALLYFSLSLFHEAEASTVILAMLAMAVAVDGASAWLRRASA
ncbi:phosphonate ABC transporter, permease protein PhnE [Zoogloea sp. LCSB751]|uniref:phosphonate ABC transporter, permease protein PhnE n=1 Tax=Zoogloea sp. LCSB751 TaxID=1965277 RepID=UPI0009A4A62C|nr:phosphonate ABC transporter, permease protein PhnE [Zoogloea sp. LCSB751]